LAYDEKGIDGTINGKSFNLTNSQIYNFNTGKNEKPTDITITNTVGTPIQIPVKSNIGNLLNIFFSYNRFLEIFDSSNNISDIINSVLSTIQTAMLGMCNLELQKKEDIPNQTSLEIVDRKISQPLPKNESTSQKPTIHRFKIGAKESIVKGFNFNMEMSTLMQAQALYSTQLAITKANNGTNTDASKEIDNFVSADLSYSKNADGYFSVNDMEVTIVKAGLRNEENKKKNQTEAEKKKQEQDKVNAEGEEKKRLNESIQSKYVKFKNNGKTPQNLIYKDSGLVQLYMVPKTPANSTALTYLDISLEIDGLAGFSCGEYFQIDGIPEIYNRNGYFQILNVKQGIDQSGWKTTIEAGYLLKTE
jgi:hypothetical protein